MKTYTVKNLSKIANVSVRTLHYYDEIGLLKPQSRSKSGYRLYGQDELLKLQQILFFRELELPLEKIKKVIHQSDFDINQSLKSHRQKMLDRIKQFKILIQTIDNTLNKLNHNTIMTDEQLYEGFASKDDPTGVKTGKVYAKEAVEKWDPKTVKASQQKMRDMNPSQWKKIQAEGVEITKKLASLMQSGLSTTDVEVQQVISEHFEHMKHFWPVNKDKYLHLGRMYVADDRFKDHYENYAKGLAAFICEGIEVFCNK